MAVQPLSEAERKKLRWVCNPDLVRHDIKPTHGRNSSPQTGVCGVCGRKTLVHAVKL